MPEDHSFPIPSNDAARGRAARALDLRARQGDPFFDAAIASAARIFAAPVAFISLIAEDRQDFLAIRGVEMTDTPRSWSMCAYTVAARRPTISPDTHDDPRFRDHPIVAQPPHLRFSASAPIILSDGFCPGTICAVDMVPHEAPTQDQVDQLTDLAAMIARFFESPLAPDPDAVARMKAVASTAQDQFLALIGHELRTPLNGIVGLTRCIDAVGDDQREIVAAVDETAAHLNNLIGSILSFTELSSGDIVLSDEVTETGTIMDRCARRFDKRFAIQGKEMRIVPGDTAAILCDPDLLELALTCLIDNVCSHGGARARVSQIIDPCGSLSITVHDNGSGIAPGRQDTIWQAFAVGNDVHTRAQDGLGLGLPLTRQIVELHGGRLAITQDDGGLTATVRLPAWRRRDTGIAAA